MRPEKAFLVVVIVGAAVGTVVALANGYPWLWFEHDTRAEATQQRKDIQSALASPAVEVAARRLATDYAENEVRADSLYRGRLLASTGNVARVFYDQMTSEPVVMLESGDDELDDIWARFDPNGVDARGELKTLHVGQRVTVECLADPNQVVPVPRMWHCALER